MADGQPGTPISPETKIVIKRSIALHQENRNLRHRMQNLARVIDDDHEITYAQLEELFNEMVSIKSGMQTWWNGLFAEIKKNNSQ